MRTVMITGAAGGIGQALAERFAKEGARLALVDRAVPEALCDRLAAEGVACAGFGFDLSDAEAIAAGVAEIGARMGIDVLVNNAGYGVIFPAEEPRVETWDATMAINLRAPWLVAAHALPYLKASGAGRVVNIASQAGIVAIAEHAAYGASKAGLIGLTKVLALEWARHGITVNAIAPTVVETPMAEIGWAGEKGLRARAEIPVGRFATPAEIAHSCAFLAAAEAAMVTGEVLVVDGGYTIR